MNLIQQQDALKHASDDQLISEMQKPTGFAPPFLVLSELTRRNRAKNEFMSAQEATGTTADRTIAERKGIRNITAPGVPTRQGSGIAPMAQPSNMENAMNVAGPQNLQPTNLPPRAAPQQGMVRGMAQGGLIGQWMADYDQSGGIWDYMTNYGPRGRVQRWEPSPTDTRGARIFGPLYNKMFIDEVPTPAAIPKAGYDWLMGPAEQPTKKIDESLIPKEEATPRIGTGTLVDRTVPSPAAPAETPSTEEVDPLQKMFQEDLEARRGFYDRMQGRLDKMDARAVQQRKQAMGLALARMGFQMAASKRGDFAAAAGEGGIAATDTLAQSNSEYDRAMNSIFGGELGLERSREEARRNDMWFKSQMATADRLKRKPFTDVQYEILKREMLGPSPEKVWDEASKILGLGGDATGAEATLAEMYQSGDPKQRERAMEKAKEMARARLSGSGSAVIDSAKKGWGATY